MNYHKYIWAGVWNRERLASLADESDRKTCNNDWIFFQRFEFFLGLVLIHTWKNQWFFIYFAFLKTLFKNVFLLIMSMNKHFFLGSVICQVFSDQLMSIFRVSVYHVGFVEWVIVMSVLSNQFLSCLIYWISACHIGFVISVLAMLVLSGQCLWFSWISSCPVDLVGSVLVMSLLSNQFLSYRFSWISSCHVGFFDSLLVIFVFSNQFFCYVGFVVSVLITLLLSNLISSSLFIKY